MDTMRDELAEGQRSLVALATDRGASGVEAAIEPPADPTVELAALLRDRRCLLLWIPHSRQSK